MPAERICQRIPHRRLAGLLCLLVCLHACTGCAPAAGVACFPVRGKVLCDGQPLADAMILLHPLNGPETSLPKPQAWSDKDGHFELTTLQSRDGAPAGHYAVTVELRELVPDGDEQVRNGRSLLPDRYRDPKTSGLSFAVQSGKNEIPPLHVQSR